MLNNITTNELINNQLVEIRKIHHGNYIKNLITFLFKRINGRLELY